MKNREKFINELVEIALNDDLLAVNKNTGIAVECCSIDCSDCLFRGNCNGATRNAWGESEWKEPVTVEAISNKFINFAQVISAQIANILVWLPVRWRVQLVLYWTTTM